MQFTKTLIAALSFGAVQAITGDLTYYVTGLGACGETHSDSDYVAAIGHALYDTATVGGNSNNNGFCGKKVKATLPDTGKTVTVTIVDKCMACTDNDLDFAGGAWRDVTNNAEPRRYSGLQWNWV